eukprot:CAMPEP_0203917316 /NCGR_PEP_ID=MMETSP0359-20131031/57972_1 /ASSEMBLY_ACC=CAM_ASM_000338 /TAXON_ID=268821 /ORGANISM="Scrippsiella Hangoei, Strain SHTV-5" /LENGTH=52 /DNA_ID=CAMNT_0050844199 /DNA_START=8 /DNA_END=166 /DNA_ORIENTATION=+
MPNSSNRGRGLYKLLLHARTKEILENKVKGTRQVILKLPQKPNTDPANQEKA